MISKFLSVLLFTGLPLGGAISPVNQDWSAKHLSVWVYFENCSHPLVAMDFQNDWNSLRLLKPCSLTGLCCVSCRSYLSSAWMGLYGDSPVLSFTVNIPHQSPSQWHSWWYRCRLADRARTPEHARALLRAHTHTVLYFYLCENFNRHKTVY